MMTIFSKSVISDLGADKILLGRQEESLRIYSYVCSSLNISIFAKYIKYASIVIYDLIYK